MMVPLQLASRGRELSPGYLREQSPSHTRKLSPTPMVTQRGRTSPGAGLRGAPAPELLAMRCLPFQQPQQQQFQPQPRPRELSPRTVSHPLTLTAAGQLSRQRSTPPVYRLAVPVATGSTAPTGASSPPPFAVGTGSLCAPGSAGQGTCAVRAVPLTSRRGRQATADAGCLSPRGLEAGAPATVRCLSPPWSGSGMQTPTAGGSFVSPSRPSRANSAAPAAKPQQRRLLSSPAVDRNGSGRPPPAEPRLAAGPPAPAPAAQAAERAAAAVVAATAAAAAAVKGPLPPPATTKIDCAVATAAPGAASASAGGPSAERPLGSRPQLATTAVLPPQDAGTPALQASVAHERAKAHKADSTLHEDLFSLFAAALAEPGTADVACRQLLAQFLGPDVQVHWEDLQGLSPARTLAQSMAFAVPSKERLASLLARAAGQAEEDEQCQPWWRALLARHGLYGRGDTLGADEFGELIVSAFRMLRDRYASEAYLRNLRTVHCGAHRLKDRYTSFEFVSRGSFGKTYKCRSRLSREEHLCRQIRKDRLAAPADHVRSEVELLRNIEHPHLPQVTESFEDFNSVYIVVELVESIELMAFLQQRYSMARRISEQWLAQVIRQVLQALQHCHELRPHSIVHGDLRLSSILLASTSDAEAAPHAVVADLGLAGLPPSLPPWPPRGGSGGGDGSTASTPRPALRGASSGIGQVAMVSSESPSPKLDVWSCGCVLFVLLAGRHPHGCDDLGGPLMPPVSPTDAISREPDWDALRHVSPEGMKLCGQMLTQEVEMRPSSTECLRHPWFLPPVPRAEGGAQPLAAERWLPLEVLSSLVQLHARSKLRQVVTNLVISELSDSPFSCVGAALAVIGACGDKGEGMVPATEVTTGLQRLGVSARGIEKVVRAFDPDGKGSVDYSRLAAGCAELAEDLLDHALWRVFTAAGEDHRGVLGAAELERALVDEGDGAAAQAENAQTGGGGDYAGGTERKPRGLLDLELKASDIVKQIAQGGHEVTFEELKDAVIHRQSTAYAAVLGSGAAAELRRGATVPLPGG